MQIAIDVNGRLGDGESAGVPVLDRGFLFGEGVYETLRTYNGQPFLLDRHLARLRASAERIALQPPLDDTAFTAPRPVFWPPCRPSMRPANAASGCC